MVVLLTPTRGTARLTLRPLRAEDAGALFALHDNAKTLHYCTLREDCVVEGVVSETAAYGLLQDERERALQ